MSRSWRIEFDGALYHVLSRGNEQQKIFADDQDRELFLELIGEMSTRFDIDVFAYVLMGNHYHLLLKTHRANLSKSMQWFGANYTRKYNIRHKRSGHLFQGRFKNFLIESPEYLLRLSCYIHRNPLRAKMVKRLADYRWSSYRVYAYGKKQPVWLKTDLIFSFFNGDHVKKIQGYRKKVQLYSREEKKLWEDFRHGLFFGTLEFVERMKRAHLPDTSHKEQPQQRDSFRFADPYVIIKKAAAVLDCDPDEFISTGRVYGTAKTNRDVLMYLIWEYGVYTNEEIGNLFHVTYSCVSKSISSFRKRLPADNNLKKLYNKIKSQIQM
ncbi:MAG: transposase [Bacteroidales bacterium]|jgi:putative transposase|nr:transposase [Bacteroidales bacterium]